MWEKVFDKVLEFTWRPACRLLRCLLFPFWEISRLVWFFVGAPELRQILLKKRTLQGNVQAAVARVRTDLDAPSAQLEVDFDIRNNSLRTLQITGIRYSAELKGLGSDSLCRIAKGKSVVVTDSIAPLGSKVCGDVIEIGGFRDQLLAQREECKQYHQCFVLQVHPLVLQYQQGGRISEMNLTAVYHYFPYFNPEIPRPLDSPDSQGA
jgi:hypothetical protein